MKIVIIQPCLLYISHINVSDNVNLAELFYK